MTNLRPPPVYKVIVAQLLATIFIASLLLLIFTSNVVAYSALMGGLISAVPNSYFAAQAFRYQGARNADKVVKSFVKGEIGKIGITIVLFALSFTLITNLNELSLILGFIAVHFVGVMMSGLISTSPTSGKT